MRWTASLLMRKPQQEPVPFQPILPLKLRNFVSGKGEKASDVCCLHEMSVLFACFKKNDFNQQFCSKEIENFQKCYVTTLNEKRLKKERESKGILNPGSKKLSYKQLNQFLKAYPCIK